jgi:Tol biopolymer transport system component
MASFSISSPFAISPDTNRIAYTTSSGSPGTYVIDLAANFTSQLTTGAVSIVSHAGLEFSGDSRYLVYATAGAQVASDTNGVADVYLYDFIGRTNLLISQSCLRPGAANAASDAPTISPDGRFIAYRSVATDIAPGATNGLAQIYIFDRQTMTNTLVSASLFGNFSANGHSLPPAFSADSQTLVFPSWASDLAAQDFNQNEDLFALKIYGSVVPVLFVGQILFVPGTGQNPVIQWPITTGKTYQIQFKNNLTDPVWQNLNAAINLNSNCATATDSSPCVTQRFYRIIAN